MRPTSLLYALILSSILTSVNTNFNTNSTNYFNSKLFAETTEKPMNSTFQPLLDQATKFKLTNGLRVIFLQRGDAPVAALYLKIRACGADESAADTGIAHMLEHMLFKGTKIQGTTDYKAEEPYIEVIDRWAFKYDRARRELEQTKQNLTTTKEELAVLEKRVAKWRTRLDLIQDDVAKFRVADEDSLLYSLNGERG